MHKIWFSILTKRQKLLSSCHILRPKRTKFDFGWTPQGELTALRWMP